VPSPQRPSLLVFSQVFVPDPASVGQHMADVTIAMAKRGHQVRVYCANRGFENPKLKYAAKENLHGVAIRRLPFSSFGKKTLVHRGLGTLSLLFQFLIIGLFKANVEGILFSTSPPFIGLACAIIAKIRGIPIIYWAMDLNPDQLLAMKKIKPNGITHRVLEGINQIILRESALIVVLDRFMAERIAERGVAKEKMLILPPWPHEQHLEDMDPSQNPFRQRHGLVDKFVIMYSGNHSPANPLATLLEASVKYKDQDNLRFLFVGGGSGKKEVENAIAKHQLKNVISLPYQPLADLKYSLSAADVHVVSLGEDMVGIIHPCKIYGAMAVGRPILFLGPRPSHVSDILEANRIGWHVAHGEVAAAEQAIEEAQSVGSATLAAMGKTARDVLDQRLSQELVCGQFCDAMEKTMKEKSL
jgi:colanic acid biosynthesis glycosyl transferase WcaI